jgi:hypothetical protein
MPFQAPMSQEQRDVLSDVVKALGRGELARLRTQFQQVNRGPWLPPPLLTVAGALLGVLVDARGGEGPWVLEESVWEEFLPDRQPVGRSEWRNANYALHAAGCLAAGVWLDVGRQESFWRLPLWPFALDLIELLVQIAAVPPVNLRPDQLQAQLLARLTAETAPR